METIARSREENDDSIHAERGDSANSGWRKLEGMPEFSSPDTAKKSEAETSTDEKSELNDDGGSFGMMDFDDISSISVPDVAKKPEDSGKSDGGDEKLLDGMEFLPFPPAASGKPEGGFDAAKKPEAGAGPDAGKKPNKYSMLVDSEGKFTDAFTLAQPETPDTQLGERFKDYRYTMMDATRREDGETFADYTKRLESMGMINDFKTYAEGVGESVTPIPDTDLGARFKKQKQEYMSRYPQQPDETLANYFQRLKRMGLVLDFADYEKAHPDDVSETVLKSASLAGPASSGEATPPLAGATPPLAGRVSPDVRRSYDSLTPEEKKKYEDFEYFMSITPEHARMAKDFGIDKPTDVYRYPLDVLEEMKKQIEAADAAAERRKGFAEANVLRTELLNTYKERLEKRGIFYEQLKGMSVDQLKALKQEVQEEVKREELINKLLTKNAKQLEERGLDRSRLEALKTEDLENLDRVFNPAPAPERTPSAEHELSDAEKEKEQKRIVKYLRSKYSDKLIAMGYGSYKKLKATTYEEASALLSRIEPDTSSRSTESSSRRPSTEASGTPETPPTSARTESDDADTRTEEEKAKERRVDDLVRKHYGYAMIKKFVRKDLLTKSEDELAAIEKDAVKVEADMKDVYDKGLKDPTMKAFFEKLKIESVDDLMAFRADHPDEYVAEVDRFKSRLEAAEKGTLTTEREVRAQMQWQLYGDALMGLGIKNVSELYGLSPVAYDALIRKASKEDEEKDALIAKIMSDPANSSLDFATVKQMKIEDVRDMASKAKVESMDVADAMKLFVKKQSLISKYRPVLFSKYKDELGGDPIVAIGKMDSDKFSDFERKVISDDREMNSRYATIMKAHKVAEKYSVFSLESFKKNTSTEEMRAMAVEAEKADPDTAKKRAEVLDKMKAHEARIVADGYSLDMFDRGLELSSLQSILKHYEAEAAADARKASA